MCGIAGFIGSAVPGQDDLAAVTAMTQTLRHRGPDDHGHHVGAARGGVDVVALGHRRLSIIDLATGHQPIANQDSSLVLVFNGEIYNYQSLRSTLVGRGHTFRTASDSETIIHAYEEWGEACVEHFRGMFAFALWDAGRQRLVLARDPFGKKPLYLAERNGRLYFASEIKALLATDVVKPSVDLESVLAYFAYRYVPGPATLFDGVRKLGPGSIATWQDGHLTERRYWSPPDREPWTRTRLPDDVAGAFREALDESVRLRMVSDVPFGAFLSGGIDSSAVVALMARHSNEPIKTFSVGFTENAYSELSYARTVADALKTDHHELTVSQESLMTYLPELVRFRDAPVSEPSDIPIYLLSLEAAKHVKMIHTGEGADEILGGYPKHSVERLRGIYHVLPQVARARLIEPLISELPLSFRRLKTAAATLALDDDPLRMVRWFAALSPDQVAALLALPVGLDVTQISNYPFEADRRASALRRILYFDQTSWLPDNLLERGDRMTMAASIEARMPFLDRELAAFVSTLPDSWLIRGRVRKYVLREAMQGVLPQVALTRRKVGFRVPVDVWFRGPMRGYLLEHLTGSDCRTRDLYHAGELQRVLTEHIEGRQNHEKLLWAMLTLELWFRQYQ
jgi:asparagine synthase (glutamine-hydrolysing)